LISSKLNLKLLIKESSSLFCFLLIVCGWVVYFIVSVSGGYFNSGIEGEGRKKNRGLFFLGENLTKTPNNGCRKKKGTQNSSELAMISHKKDKSLLQNFV